MVSTKVAVTMTPEMRADAAMLAVCRRLAEIAEATLPGTLEDLDPEFLHDFRVAIRRTRSMLRELAGVLPAEVEDRARSDLRRVQAVTGPTRDLDVYLQDWDELVGGVALPALHAELMRRRAEAFGAMSADLRGEPFTSGWAHWRAACRGSDR
jgi:CHAD domain-containing protein